MEKLHDQNIERLVNVSPPEEYLRGLPISGGTAQQVLDKRRQIRDILTGDDDRMLLVVGPCSIHEEEAGLEYASRLAELAEQVEGRILVVMRVYFEKPRTIMGWKGFINDPTLTGELDLPEGLRRARKFLLDVAELGLPAGTEWLDTITPQYLADLISWGAIGARTTESQTHRELASGLSMPIGFKNGTGGTLHSIRIGVNGAVAARSRHAFMSTDSHGKVIVAYTKGNPHSHLILRGGEQGPNHGPEYVAAACRMLDDHGLSKKLIIDCSHGNSDKDYERQFEVFQEVLQQRLDGNPCIAGMMLESHLYEGKQDLNGRPDSLRYGVSITDGCIGWKRTEELIRQAYDDL